MTILDFSICDKLMKDRLLPTLTHPRIFPPWTFLPENVNVSFFAWKFTKYNIFFRSIYFLSITTKIFVETSFFHCDQNKWARRSFKKSAVKDAYLQHFKAPLKVTV